MRLRMGEASGRYAPFSLSHPEKKVTVLTANGFSF